MFLNSHLPPKAPCRGLCFGTGFPPTSIAGCFITWVVVFCMHFSSIFSICFQSARNPTNFPTFAQPFCMVLLRFTSWSVELRERGGAFPTPRNRVQVMWCRFTLGYDRGVHLLDPKYEEYAYRLQTQKIWKRTIVKGSNAEPVRPIQLVLRCRIFTRERKIKLQNMILVRGGFVKTWTYKVLGHRTWICCMCADCMYSTWECKTEERQPGSLFKQH